MGRQTAGQHHRKRYEVITGIIVESLYAFGLIAVAFGIAGVLMR